MADNPKTTCAAFGCKRWTRRIEPGWEFLCQDHWQMVPRRLRRLHNKAKRRAERYGTPKECERAARLWAKCRAAVDRNIGL